MVARLRTLAGCLTCRRRRKKCGEERPDCERCSRSNLQCLWPDNRRIDGRRRRRQCAGDATSDVVPSGPSEICLEHIDHRLPGNIDLMLPLQFLRSRPEHTVDVSYIETLCRKSSLVRNAVLACISISEPSNSTNEAWNLYTTALSNMSAQLSTGIDSECNDYTLTAAVWLCIFESSRFEGGLQISLHLRGLYNLLISREPLSHTTTPSNILAWERTCVESFLYLCVVATIVDNAFDAGDLMQPVMERYSRCLRPILSADISSSLDFVFRSPVLGAPPDIFLILVQAIELARRREKLTPDAEMNAWKLYNDVRGWELILDARSAVKTPDGCLWMGKIYAVMSRIILIHMLRTFTCCPDSEHPHRTELHASMNEAARILENADDYLECSWTKYILWPLAVIGAVSLSDDKIKRIRRMLQRSGERSACNTAKLIQAVLEQIWSEHIPSPGHDYMSASMNALHTLLSGTMFIKTIDSMLLSSTNTPG